MLQDDDMADQPATKKDLEEFRAEMSRRFEEVDARFEALEKKISEGFDAMIEKMRDMHSEILRAFIPWQQSDYSRSRKSC